MKNGSGCKSSVARLSPSAPNELFHVKQRMALGEDLHIHRDRGPADFHHFGVEADDIADRNRLLEQEEIHRHGGDVAMGWEQTDQAEALKVALS